MGKPEIEEARQTGEGLLDSKKSQAVKISMLKTCSHTDSHDHFAKWRGPIIAEHYPQLTMADIMGNPTDPPRDVAFGTGPVCHVKTTPTLIPLIPCWSAIQLMGPIWPVEMDEVGAFRTVGVPDLGLFHATETWSDIFVTFSCNGLMQDVAVYGSDGVELMNAMMWQSGSVTAADRFVKGSALYFAALSPHYWLVEGVKQGKEMQNEK